MNLFSKNGGSPGLSKIALLGTYTPRQCGIATFTADLRNALAKAEPDSVFDVIAVSDVLGAYEYPGCVRFEIDQDDPASYCEAAEYLNRNGYEALCIQHEYGIFGGPAGNMLLEFLRSVEMPIFVTLHTILSNPDPEQLRVIKEMGRIASGITVISEKGVEILKQVYSIPSSIIRHIHHGVPGPATSTGEAASRVSIPKDSNVLLTFGLISPDKGLENVIRAMPQILEREPNTVYLIVGATHPHIRARHGESYREGLQQLANELGVGNNVRFLNRYVELSELSEFLALADIYITPYLKEQQISSGTLAYAVGSGRATISTPYWYASELLAGGRGILVPFHDPNAIANSVLKVLTDGNVRAEMERRTLELGRKMLWSEVGRAYFDLMEETILSRSGSRRELATRETWRVLAAPSYKLDHLVHMTDDTGLLQHAKYTIPNHAEGYSLDDNVRALILASHLLASKAVSSPDPEPLLKRYLAFTAYALNPDLGRFRNFMSYDRRWLEDAGSEDSHGRALWALGTVCNKLPGTSYATLADDLFHAALDPALAFRSPRAIAYTLLGICEMLANERCPVMEKAAKSQADKLYSSLREYSSHDWLWFEEVVSYCNARLPQALIVAGHFLGQRKFVDDGLQSLDWLCRLQTSSDGFFEPVGSERCLRKGEEKPRFDQQPVEAHATLSACISAWELTGAEVWHERASLCFEWFQGFNHLRGLVCDPTTGGCRDGLHETRFNENQGAESMLSWLLALAEMQQAGFAQTHPEELPAYLS